MKKRKIIKRNAKPETNFDPTLDDNHNAEIRKRMKLTQKELAEKLGVSLKQVKLWELERRPTFKGDSYKEGEQPFMFHPVDTRAGDCVARVRKQLELKGYPEWYLKQFDNHFSSMIAAAPQNNRKIVTNDPADLATIKAEGIYSTAKAMPLLDYLQQKDMGYDCQTREDLINFIHRMGQSSEIFYSYAGAKRTNQDGEWNMDGLDENAKELCRAVKLLREKLERTMNEVSQCTINETHPYVLAKRMFELGREYQKAESVKYTPVAKDGAMIKLARPTTWKGIRKKNEWTKLSAAGHDNNEVLGFLVAEYRKEEIDNPRYIGIHESVMIDAKRKFGLSEKSNSLNKTYSHKRILKEISRLKILECKKTKTAIKK